MFSLALQPALQAAARGGPPELRPSLVVAYLDDVYLAGSYRQVSAGLVRLTAGARQVGLQVNPAKCELVACGGAAATVDMSLFPPDIPLNQTGTFSLLGAPIGDGRFCNQFTTSERVAKALPLLDALAVLPDAQTALLLLRHCASHCRMAYSIRVTPPDGLGPSLEAFDNAGRGCLEVACSGPLTVRKRGSKQHSPLGVVGSGSAAWPGTVSPATLLLCGLLRHCAKIWILATTLTSMLLSTW